MKNLRSFITFSLVAVALCLSAAVACAEDGWKEVSTWEEFKAAYEDQSQDANIRLMKNITAPSPGARLVAENREKNIDLKVVNDEDIYVNLKKANERVKLLTKLTNKKVIIREIEDAKLRQCTFCYSGNYCYSSLGEAMVVTANGDTYPCSSFVGNKDYYMGNINESINIIKLNSGKYEKCSSCEYEKICKGCCPSRMVFNEKYDIEEKDCVLRKAIFRILKEDRIQEEMNG